MHAEYPNLPLVEERFQMFLSGQDIRYAERNIYPNFTIHREGILLKRVKK